MASSIYVDELLGMKVVVKNKFAYIYKKGNIFMARVPFENRRRYIDRLFKVGYKHDENNYQESLKKLR